MQDKNNTKKIVSKVIIPIDTIDDIYSDFDLRNIKIRALSKDFINEVKTQSKYSEDNSSILITIYAPKRIKRKELPPKIESLTKKRIKQHFEDEYYEVKHERRNKLIRAGIFISAGLACFFIMKIVGNYKVENILMKTVFELIIFCSWFATWNGVDILSDRPSSRIVRWMRRISEAEIHFKFIKDFSSL